MKKETADRLASWSERTNAFLYQIGFNMKTPPLNKAARNFIEWMGFYSKETIDNFDKWYKPVLTEREQSLYRLSKIPIIAPIAAMVYEISPQKVNTLQYLMLSQHGAQIENPHEFTHNQLISLSVASHGNDISKLLNPDLSPLEIRMATEFLNKEDFVPTSENLVKARQEQFFSRIANRFNVVKESEPKVTREEYDNLSLYGTEDTKVIYYKSASSSIDFSLKIVRGQEDFGNSGPVLMADAMSAFGRRIEQYKETLFSEYEFDSNDARKLNEIFSNMHLETNRIVDFVQNNPSQIHSVAPALSATLQELQQQLNIIDNYVVKQEEVNLDIKNKPSLDEKLNKIEKSKKEFVNYPTKEMGQENPSKSDNAFTL